MSTRTDIRNALKTTLQALEGINADNVMTGRHRTVPQNKLPAICVYTENEEKQTDALGSPRILERNLTAQLEIHVQAATPAAVETALDAWSAKIETALLANETLSGLAREIIPLSDQYIGSEEGERPAGVAICQYAVIYE